MVVSAVDLGSSRSYRAFHMSLSVHSIDPVIAYERHFAQIVKMSCFMVPMLCGAEMIALIVHLSIQQPRPTRLVECHVPRSTWRMRSMQSVKRDDTKGIYDRGMSYGKGTTFHDSNLRRD